MTELVVDIIAEKIKKEHISCYMQKAGVQERIADKLPEMQLPGPRIKHELFGPFAKILRLAGKYVGLKVIGQNENKHVDNY